MQTARGWTSTQAPFAGAAEALLCDRRVEDQEVVQDAEHVSGELIPPRSSELYSAATWATVTNRGGQRDDSTPQWWRYWPVQGSTFCYSFILLKPL